MKDNDNIGERLTGGKAAIYLANNMFRIDDNAKYKYEPIELNNKGKTKFTVIKSRKEN